MARQKTPNVMLITVDQWSANLLGCAGHPVIETPTLDALARSGTRFTRANAECPVCIPSRRSLMTGMTARAHGDRIFQPALPMPDAPTLAGTFRDAGYQTWAVGKLHVYPPRDRIGFDDALVAEEGRGQLGITDDYELFLADRGHPGEQFLHGMSNNEYSWRPWHLPEDCHVTNWTARTMARTIKRRDPTRPAFWYTSFTHPHPPLAPLQSYLDRYARRTIDRPVIGDWANDGAPHALRAVRNYYAALPEEQLLDMRRAYYALCTHIDHQIRIVVGTLREEGLLDDTLLLFTSDHGEMLGDHGLFAKRCLLAGSTAVPLIVVPPKGIAGFAMGATDDRVTSLHDIMPTLLDVCGIDRPATCEGLSLAGDERRDVLYGESQEGAQAMRMVMTSHHKLIWYVGGNRVQLFDLDADPGECRDLSDEPGLAEVRASLTRSLIAHLYGGDERLVDGDRLIGLPEPALVRKDNRGLSGQRGLHYPVVPIDSDPARVVGAA